MAITELRVDVHTHTLESKHAYSTIGENLREAGRYGLEMLGSSDHFGAGFAPSCPPNEIMKVYQFWFNQAVWPRVHRGVKLLRGCEVDIVDMEGHLYGHDIVVAHWMSGAPKEDHELLKDMVFGRMDYVIASLHNIGMVKDTTPLENTKLYLGALEDPKVIGLGHIGRAGNDFDVDAVVTAARDLNKLIEINEHTFDSTDGQRCRRIAERCAELGCKIMVGTDAHICYSVGRFNNAVAMLNRIDFPEELVATRNAAAFERALKDGVGTVVDWGVGPDRSAM